MVTTQVLLLLAAASTGDTVLLDFSSRWCAPCRQMDSTVQRLASAGYPVRKIDVDQQRELAARFRVTSVPCFVLVSGGREVDRVVGAVSHARLVQMFEKSRGPSSPQQLGLASQPNQQVRGQSPGRGFGGVSFPDPRQLFGSASGKHSTSDVPPSDPLAANHDSSTRAAGVHKANVNRALAATVRLQVDDPAGHSFGTGTVIDVHTNEALIVTCGHIFRDSGGRGHIRVDFFVGGEARSVSGTLISFDLERDVALVSFVPSVALNPAPVAPAGTRFHPGDMVFSIGCDRGADPSVRTSRIVGVDKYLGPPNIEVVGEPVNGRSGGGLFTADGLLIGICNFADPTDNEGIYASLPNIHWELDRIGQQRIYAGSSATRGAGQVAGGNSPNAIRTPGALGEGGTVPANDTEVICIVRSKTDPRGGERLLILSQPSQELLDRLARESGPNGSVADRRPLPPVQTPRFGRQPIIRAQSSGR